MARKNQGFTHLKRKIKGNKLFYVEILVRKEAKLEGFSDLAPINRWGSKCRCNYP